ncbi:MAG: chemotaxis protein CheW [Gemmatimonadetes bacterium]|nr:chemotaxis protein CheW [Gemmatimonadota bacterium]
MPPPLQSGDSLLAFRIDDVHFGLPSKYVVEVVRAVAVRPLPGAPFVVHGMIDYRGTVVPVYDVARRFRGADHPVRLSDIMIVVQAGPRLAALLVHAVDALVTAESAMSAPPVPLPPESPVAGVVTTEGGMLLIQDLGRFLSDAETWSLDRAMRQASAR